MEEVFSGWRRNRSSWAEVIGLSGEVAAGIIAGQNPKLHVEIVKDGMMVSSDHRPNRVRIWVDENGIVKQVQIG